MVDRINSRKIPDWVNKEAARGIRLDNATYVGIVKNNLDPLRAGRLQVWIPDLGGNQEDQYNWRTVSYASPFYGSTFQPSGASASKNNKFDEVRHTYGMWMVPPDLGNQVLCTFAAGDPNRGYWFACVNPDIGHYMVPGMAATNQVDIGMTVDSVKSRIVSSSVLPVAEFNDSSAELDQYVTNPKPIHEYQATVLMNQGLDRDPVRGAISSSSQREIPSTVFGVSTPGRPVDDPANDPSYADKVKSGKLREEDLAVRTRKGGHQFVMDDGDVKGVDQLIRLRTAGGHQLLMNDTERIVYVGNSDGSVWIELTGGGHLNIYSSSSVNIRAEQDFNFHADGNMNFHCGDQMKIFAGSGLNVQTPSMGLLAQNFLVDSDNISLKSDGALLMSGASGGIKTEGALKLSGSKVMLNTEPPAKTSEVKPLGFYKQSDTGWDEKTRLWITYAEAFESLAEITPCHEPWQRDKGSNGAQKADTTIGSAAGTNPGAFNHNAGTPGLNGAAPLNSKNSSVCAPRNAGAYVPSKSSSSKNGVQPWAYDKDFIDYVKKIATKYSIDYIEVLAMLYQESQCDPSVQNSIGATGLIQFVPSVAKELGTTTDQLRTMSRVEQMVWVEKYFAKWLKAGRSYDVADMYMSINYPVAVGKPMDYVLYSRPNKAYEYNKGQDTNNDSGVTKQEAVALVLNKIPHIKSQLEKASQAGGAPVTDGSGAPVTDGSGNAIGTGSSSLDPGISAGLKASALNPAPKEYMKREDIPKQQGGFPGSGKVPGLIPKQVQALMVQLAYTESGVDYSKEDAARGTLGAYQFSGISLVRAEYLKKDYLAQYKNSALNMAAAWTGKDGISSKEDFLNGRSVQDSLMYTVLQENYSQMVRVQAIKPDDTVCEVAGMLAVAHLFQNSSKGLTTGDPHDQAKFWREQATQTDERGIRGEVYFATGRYAIDVLSVDTAVVNSLSPNPATNAISNDPSNGYKFEGNLNEIFQFTSGSGDEIHFRQSEENAQKAFIAMGQEYLKTFKQKLRINSSHRSPEEQEKLYETFHALIKQQNLPPGTTVVSTNEGKIFMPAKPPKYGGKPNKHYYGLALDMPKDQIAQLISSGLLAKYGLIFPFPINDPIHVQMG